MENNMGHYDNCRDGYCAKCGAAPGNLINGKCEFCRPEVKKEKPKVKKKTAEKNK